MVAVGSRDRARGEEFADRHGIGRVHGSYEDLLADDDVEAVYIPLPNSLHVPWSITALEAGKHVLCEKPLTPPPGRRRAAFDAADAAGRVLMEAFMWRYHPQTEALARLAGEIGAAAGRPRGVRLRPARRRHRQRAPAARPGRRRADGRRVLLRVRPAAAVRRARAGERRGGGLRRRRRPLRRACCGSTATCSARSTAPSTCERGAIEVVGAGGTLVSEDPWHGATPRLTLTRPGEAPEEVPVDAANAYGLRARGRLAPRSARRRSPRWAALTRSVRRAPSRCCTRRPARR